MQLQERGGGRPEKQKGEKITSWDTLWQYAGRKVKFISNGVEQGVFQIPTNLKEDDNHPSIHLWSVGEQGNTPSLREEHFNPDISKTEVILED